MTTNTGDSTNNNIDTQSGNSDAKSTIPLVIEEGKLTTVSAVVSRTGDGLAFASVNSETTPIQPRQSEDDSSTGDGNTDGNTDTSGGDTDTDGQTTPTPAAYYLDADSPIENVYYDEWIGYNRSEGIDNATAAENHAIYLIFRRGYTAVPGEWRLTMTDVYGNVAFPTTNNPAWESPTAQTYSGGVTLREPPRLRFRFTRRYSNNRAGATPGLDDERMNEIDRIDQGADHPHRAERGVPPRMNITIIHTHGGRTRQWSAVLDVQARGLDGSATNVSFLRPTASRLCVHSHGVPPKEYREGRLPEGITPSRDDCRNINRLDDGTLEYIKPEPLPMVWNQLIGTERAANPGKLRAIGFNNTVTMRFNGGFRLFDPDRVALEVVEVSPVKAASDSLCAEVSFNGRDWIQLKLLGRLLKGNEAANGAGAAHIFYIIWRFAGLPRQSAVSTGSGFRVRVRDLTIHPPSLSDAEEAGGLLPTHSKHPYWRYGRTDEENPGADLTDVVVLSDPIQKIRYLFVLDHSGSMQGTRIANLRRAVKSAMLALEKAMESGTVEIEVGLRVFQHRHSNSAAGDLTRFSGWQSFAGYMPPATPPTSTDDVCGDGWIPDPSSPAGRLLTWLCGQRANGETPLQQSVQAIPNDLGTRTPGVLDFVILLSDGMHTGLVSQDDPNNPGQQMDVPVSNVNAGAAGLHAVVGGNNLPDKLFIIGLEVVGNDRQSIELMRDESPVYLDQELIKYMTEAGVTPARQAAFLTAMRAQPNVTTYITLGNLRTALAAIPAATIPDAAKTLIQQAANRRARDRIEVQYVANSNSLTRAFMDFIRDFVTGSRGCLQCEAPRAPVPAVTGYTPPTTGGE